MNELLQLMSGVWAISEEGLHSLMRRVRPGAQGSDSPAMLSFTEPERSDGLVPRQDYGRVAVLEVYGTLVKRTRWSWSGIASYENIRASLDAAMADSGVDAVVLDIDSPGGNVDGCKELADHVFSLRERKPIYALANGTMTSGAQYLGAATGNVYASSPTVRVGSIGVLALHTDWSKWNDMLGISPTWLHSGRFKVMGNPDEPLSEEASRYLQGNLDHTYNIFLADVARYLGLDPARSADWADGRVLDAEAGLELGLVKGIMTRQELIASIQEEAMTKTAAQLRNDYPEAVQEIVNSVEAKVKADAERQNGEAVAAATAQGRDEVMTMVGAVLGDAARDRLEPLMAAGVTPEQLVAIGYTPEQTEAKAGDEDARAAILDQLKAQDPAGVKAGADPASISADQKLQARIDRIGGLKI